MSRTTDKVVIVGAGLGGLTLALSLHRHSIPCELYELRPRDYTHGGALMLSPNALRVLDSVNGWKVAKDRGFAFETLTFLTDAHEVTGQYYFGSEPHYGYSGFRIYRNKLVEILMDLVKVKGIPIHHDRKFSHVISESDNSVTLAFADGQMITTPRLIGADGTHSRVRKYFAPHAEPIYSGSMGVTSAVPYSALRLPHHGYPLPSSIAGNHGAFIMAPQDRKGSEVFIGRQLAFPARDRQGWNDLEKGQDHLLELLTSPEDGWSNLVRSAMNAAKKGRINFWAFHTLPKLETWYSDKGRVVIMGDAAHAIPPIAGQGANQALEDAFTLAWLLNRSGAQGCSREELAKWMEYRQGRIEKVIELNANMAKMRLPLAEQRELQDFHLDFGSVENMRWLFGAALEEEMEALFEANVKVETD